MRRHASAYPQILPEACAFYCRASLAISDLIAAGLSPFAPEAAALKAGRLMLNEIAALAKRGESFAFETTLSGRSYLRQTSIQTDTAIVVVKDGKLIRIPAEELRKNTTAEPGSL